MKQKIIQQGAEAIISLQDNQIIKNRIKKSYRLPEIDNKLRTRRTKAEAKIIDKLSNIINVPKIIKEDKEKKQIIMQFIDGKKLSEHLEKLDWKEICKQIGEHLTKIHNQNIIHGDLTTSNMIYKDTKKESPNKKESSKEERSCLYFIDFGLGFHSHKVEDKAVDLHLLKQALDAKHYKIADKCFKIILQNYKADKHDFIIKRISAIEKRGRYKGH